MPKGKKGSKKGQKRQRSGLLGFISQIGTLNSIDIEIGTIYGQRSFPFEFISQKRYFKI